MCINLPVILRHHKRGHFVIGLRSAPNYYFVQNCFFRFIPYELILVPGTTDGGNGDLNGKMSVRIIYVLYLFRGITAFVPRTSTNFAIRPSSKQRSLLPVGSYQEGSIYQNKTSEELEFIQNALLQNSLFNNLSDDSTTEVVDAFERCQSKMGEKIVSQGDSCDGSYVYLIKEGQCRVVVDQKVAPEPYGTLKPGAIFGELGILYESTRAATIEAKSLDVTYYRLRGDIFKTILNQPTDSWSWSDLKAIDDAINQVSGTNALYGGNVILPYQPQRVWLWKQYSGTVLKISLITTIGNMLISALFVLYARSLTGEPLRAIGVGAPDNSLPFIRSLSHFGAVWDILQTLTTFILTFFVNQAFNFWKRVYQLARNVQMGLNNFNLLVATNVRRDDDGVPTEESSQLLDDIARYSRLFYILMWASKSKRFSCLITPHGLQRMESRGLMTRKELEVLQNLDVTSDRLFIAPLEWMILRYNKAAKNAVLDGIDPPTKGHLLKQMVDIREHQASISNSIDGRMPLAYAHLVQILVDTFVLTAPLALYPKLGDFSVFAIAVTTLFYTGLNNLAKIFLDPLNNEPFKENSIFMDLGVFIRENNVASDEYQSSGRKLPF